MVVFIILVGFNLMIGFLEYIIILKSVSIGELNILNLFVVGLIFEVGILVVVFGNFLVLILFWFFKDWFVIDVFLFLLLMVDFVDGIFFF